MDEQENPAVVRAIMRHAKMTVYDCGLSSFTYGTGSGCALQSGNWNRLSSAAFYSQTENTIPRCQYRSGFDQPPLRLIFTSPESLFTSPESVFTSVRNLYSHRCGIPIHIVRNTHSVHSIGGGNGFGWNER